MVLWSSSTKGSAYAPPSPSPPSRCGAARCRFEPCLLRQGFPVWHVPYSPGNHLAYSWRPPERGGRDEGSAQARLGALKSEICAPYPRRPSGRGVRDEKPAFFMGVLPVETVLCAQKQVQYRREPCFRLWAAFSGNRWQPGKTVCASATRGRSPP